jgi:hypothetical protein
MLVQHTQRLLLLLLLCGALLSCGGTVEGAGAIRLEFRPGAQGASLPGEPRTSTRALEITRLDWLVSGLALQRKDGSWAEGREWFGFLSAADGRLHVDADGVPAEEFRAIRFVVGVDPATDKADPAQWPPEHALNPAVNRLHWGWQSGYVFLALEGRRHGTAGTAEGFS